MVANTEGTVATSDLIDSLPLGVASDDSPLIARALKSAVTLTLYLRLLLFPTNLRAHYVLDEGEIRYERVQESAPALR